MSVAKQWFSCSEGLPPQGPPASAQSGVAPGSTSATHMPDSATCDDNEEGEGQAREDDEQ